MLLKKLLSRKDLPPSVRTLYMCQMLMVCASIREYLDNIIQRPACVSSAYSCAQLPDDWLIAQNQSVYCLSDEVIAATQVDDLNANLPQSYWVSWAKDRNVESLRAQVILAAWLRSKLLGQDNGVDDLLVRAYPSLRKLMTVYKSAPAGETLCARPFDS